MRARDLEDAPHEMLLCRIPIGVMREQAERFRCAGAARTPPAQFAQEKAGDEALVLDHPTATPIDEIEMRVDLRQAARGVRFETRLPGRDAAKTKTRQLRERRRDDAIPRRHQNGQHAWAKG